MIDAKAALISGKFEEEPDIDGLPILFYEFAYKNDPKFKGELFEG